MRAHAQGLPVDTEDASRDVYGLCELMDRCTHLRQTTTHSLLQHSLHGDSNTPTAFQSGHPNACPPLIPTAVALAMRVRSPHLTFMLQPMSTVIIADVFVIQQRIFKCLQHHHRLSVLGMETNPCGNSWRQGNVGTEMFNRYEKDIR